MPKKTTKAKAAPNPAIKRVIDAYHTAFLQRHGVKPLIAGGKDATLVKQMIATWGEETVLALVAEFIASNDPWATRRGWTLAALYDVAPRLLTRHAAVDGRTGENLDAAARAMRPRP